MRVVGSSGFGPDIEHENKNRCVRSIRLAFRTFVFLAVTVFGCAHTAAEPIERGSADSASAGKGESSERSGLQGPAPRISDEKESVFPCPRRTLLEESWKQAAAWEREGELKKAAGLLERTARSMEGRVLVELEAEVFRLYLKARWPERALLALDRYAKATNRGYERAYAGRRMRDLAARLAGPRVLDLYRLTRPESLLRGALAPWVAAYYRSRGETRKADDYLDDTVEERAQVETLARRGVFGDTGRLAVIVSFSGPYRRFAVPALQGVLLAADVYGGSRGGQGMEVIIADPSDMKDGVEFLEELKYGRNVLAAVGPVDPEQARSLAAAAGEVELPLITLTPDPSVTHKKRPYVFRYLPDNSLRVKALASAMMKRLKPNSRVGIIYPSSSAGREMLKVFKEALSDSGISVVAESAYSPGATHFARQAKEMRNARVQGIFAVASAGTLRQLTPQLALVGIWSGTVESVERGGSGRTARRTVLLAATADGMDAGLLKSTNRYLQGALLCPGFFPMPGDPRWGEFARDFTRAYGMTPDIIAGHAYEAALRARQVLEDGRHGGDAATVAKMLSKIKGPGGGELFDGRGDVSMSPGVFEVLGVTVRRLD